MHDTIKPYINLRHRQQSHNKGLYYGFKDAVLSYLIPMHPYKVVRPSVQSYNLEIRAFLSDIQSSRSLTLML